MGLSWLEEGVGGLPLPPVKRFRCLDAVSAVDVDDAAGAVAGPTPVLHRQPVHVREGRGLIHDQEPIVWTRDDDLVVGVG